SVEGVAVGGTVKATANRVHRLLDRALFAKLSQGFLDPGKAFVEKLLLLLEHSNVVTSGRRDLGDARTHQAAAEYAHFLDMHMVPISPQRTQGTAEVFCLKSRA